jgi:hypothetical protein
LGQLADLSSIPERHSSWRNGRAEREERDVDYFAGFDRHVIGKRNERTRHEVRTLRLVKRLRENGEPRPYARLADFVSKSTQPLLRRAGLAG